MAVLKQRVDSLEPRVEHVHRKGHDTGNRVTTLALEMSEIRNSVKGTERNLDRLEASSAQVAEAVNRLALNAEGENERFKAMQDTMNAVLSSIRAVAIGSATVVIGAMLVEVMRRVSE